MHTLTRPLAVVAAATLALLAGSVVPASAAPGDAFDPARPTIFISQGTPTQLATATVGADDNFSLSPEGGPQAGVGEYNAIGFNTADNFLYGITSTAIGSIPAASLVKIGQDGVVVSRIGTGTFVDPSGSNPSLQVGAFGPGGFLYAADTTGSNMYVINVTTGAIQATRPITGGSLGGTLVSDWSFSQGYLWGVGENFTIVRVDPATGALNQFTTSATQVSPGFAGAAWTYADGALGFSHNISGRIDRIEVTNPASATPTFTLVDSRGGPSNGRNDGAANPGLPADLAVTKTSAGFAPGAKVTYTVTVKNNGAGFSTGWTITDAVPSALTGVAATSTAAKCAVTGNAVSCKGGALSPGASATVTVTANVPAGQTASVRNEVTVVGNEPDPVAANNTAAVVDQVTPNPTPTPTDDGAVSPDDDEIVPDDPSVPAGGEGVVASSDHTLGLLGLTALGMAAIGGAVVVRRRIS